MTTHRNALRPLGPYGEGYCRLCHFIEPLAHDGRLADHVRGASFQNSKPCKGSGKMPQKIIPKESRKAAFRVNAPLVECHICKRQVILLVDGRISGHTLALRVLEQCKGGFHFPPEGARHTRNHGADRGPTPTDSQERG